MIDERQAHELVQPLESLPAIQARKKIMRDRQRERPIRLAIAIGAIGLLGVGSAAAAIEQLSGEAHLKRELRIHLEHQAKALRQLEPTQDFDVKKWLCHHGSRDVKRRLCHSQ